MTWRSIALCLLLAGCSTPYQELGLTGGVASQRITATTYRIKSRGNGYTDRATVQDYTLLKAAETTKAAGGTHFMIVGAEDASRSDAIVSPASATTTVTGSVAYTSFSPATVSEIIKPGQDTYIRVVSLAPGERAPPGAFTADEIIQFIGSRVKRG